jgi:hypothetical protein
MEWTHHGIVVKDLKISEDGTCGKEDSSSLF